LNYNLTIGYQLPTPTTTMPLTFANDEINDVLGARSVSATTVQDDDDSSDDEGGSETGSAGSASEYGGPAQKAPGTMFFCPMECRAIFELPSEEEGKIQRVCGRKIGTCTRQGHIVLAKGTKGYYKTIASRKYADGRLATFVVKAAFEAEEMERKGKAKGNLESAAKWLRELGSSPGGSAEAGYGDLLEKGSEGKSEDIKKEGDGRGGKDVGRGGKDVGKVKDEEVHGGRRKDMTEKSRPRAIDTDFLGVASEGHENHLLSSPTVQEIAKKGNTEMALIGLMDRLAGAVTESNTRIAGLEKE
jgi:hypothetical protein